VNITFNQGANMPADLNRLLSDLSRADLQKLLAAKEESETLEKRRAALMKELATVEKQLARLVAVGVGGGRRTAARKAAPKARRKAAGKKAAGKKAAGKRKAAARRTGKRATAAAGGGRTTLEEVVVAILQERGTAMPFKEMHAAIVDGKLFRTRSKNFANVLRRTLSTSERVKRKARGVYGL
jgi:hypothetical protein